MPSILRPSARTSTRQSLRNDSEHRYPNEYDGTKSGYIKDIKTGIFVEHFNGELVVAATMEATNDNPNIAAKFSSKTVNIRLDFWALFTDASDDVKYKKLDNITPRATAMQLVRYMVCLPWRTRTALRTAEDCGGRPQP